MKPLDANERMQQKLRAEAEARLLKQKESGPSELQSDELLHELQVHQIELEMQNETLRQTQLQLEESRDRYLELYEFAPVGYLMLSSDGLIDQVNLAGVMMLGVERKKLLRKRFGALVSAEDQDRWVQHLRRAKQSAEPVHEELLLRRGENLTFHAHLDSVQVRSAAAEEGGDSVPIRIVLSDISQRKEAEAAHAAIIEASLDAIISVDEDEHVAVFNAAAERMFRLSAAEAKGQLLSRFIPEQFRDGHHAHLRRFKESRLTTRSIGERTSMMFALRADGSEFPFDASISQTVTAGRRFFTVTMRDISERIRAETLHAALEAQLRESQKMEAMGTLAGGIAHDFNNIIASILGNAGLARQDVTDNPKALESLDEIRKSATRARDLVQQILSFSRRQQTERKSISLVAALEEVVRLLRATLPSRVQLEVELYQDVPNVSADATQIEQVVLNLVTNAVQALQGSAGRINIQLDTVLLDATLAAKRPKLLGLYETSPGSTIRLVVADDGPGMDEATRARIFEPFFTTKPVGEGTGMGLAVVHGIVQAHGGVIDVDSEPGRGTAFTIYLPEHNEETDLAVRRAKSPRKFSPGKGTGQRILYIDDDESLVFLVERLLERRGIDVTGYTDSMQALEVLRANPFAFDVVVTDYNMPGMSGLDVARMVRGIRPDLPLIVASGFVDEELQVRAADAGVREVIFKVRAAEELCSAFERVAQTYGEGHGQA